MNWITVYTQRTISGIRTYGLINYDNLRPGMVTLQTMGLGEFKVVPNMKMNNRNVNIWMILVLFVPVTA